MKHFFSLIVILTIGLNSCSNNSDRSEDRTTKVSTGEARILGTVMDIQAELDTLRPDSPCGKVPCNTIVRIDSIIGYGASFGKPLIPQSEISLKFMFTTEKTTDELFPNLKESYPGISINSKFSGDIQQVKSYETGKEIITYRIYEYQLINQ